MSFPISHAGLAGLRLVGRRPVSVLLWTLTFLVFCAAMVALLVAVAWPTLVQLDRFENQTLGHAEALKLFGPLALAIAVILPIALLMNGVVLAAIYRAVLKPEKVGFGYLRLGGDELRLVLVGLLQTLLGMVFVAGPVVAIVHLRALIPFTSGHWAAVVLGCVVALLAYLWVGVRLSLAGPMTLAAGRVRFWKSWTVTRGRFWPLLAMYLLANVLALVIYFIGDQFADAALTAAGFGGPFAYSGHHLPELSGLTQDVCIGLGLYFLLQMLLSTVQVVVAYAPQAAAFRALSPEGEG